MDLAGSDGCTFLLRSQTFPQDWTEKGVWQWPPSLVGRLQGDVIGILGALPSPPELHKCSFFKIYRLRYSEHNYFLAYKANSILKIWLLSLELYACLIFTFMSYCWQWLILQAKHFSWFDRVLASCLNWVEATLSPQLGWVVGSTSIWGSDLDGSCWLRPTDSGSEPFWGLWDWSLLLQSVVRAHLLSAQPEGTAKSNNLLGKLARESLRSSEINSRLYLPVPRFSVRVFNWVKNGYKINNVFMWTAVALTCLSVLLLECRIHPRKPLCNYRERRKK